MPKSEWSTHSSKHSSSLPVFESVWDPSWQWSQASPAWGASPRERSFGLRRDGTLLAVAAHSMRRARHCQCSSFRRWRRRWRNRLRSSHQGLFKSCSDWSLSATWPHELDTASNYYEWFEATDQRDGTLNAIRWGLWPSPGRLRWAWRSRSAACQWLLSRWSAGCRMPLELWQSSSWRPPDPTLRLISCYSSTLACWRIVICQWNSQPSHYRTHCHPDRRQH